MKTRRQKAKQYDGKVYATGSWILMYSSLTKKYTLVQQHFTDNIEQNRVISGVLAKAIKSVF